MLQQCRLIRERSAARGAEGQAALLADLVHMQLNRVFSIAAREQELLTYHVLQLYWRGLRARAQRP